MPKPSDPIKLLKQAAGFFDTQGKFMDAALLAFHETHPEIRPGPRSKMNGIQIFKAITQYQLKQIRQSKSLPSTRSIAKHISNKFTFSMSRAKVYVGIWRRWYWRGITTLTPHDRAWLEKNYPTIAIDFFSKWWLRSPALIRRHSAHVKALQDPELDRLIDELRGEVWRLHPPLSKSDESKYLTRAELLKLLKT